MIREDNKNVFMEYKDSIRQFFSEIIVRWAIIGSIVDIHGHRHGIIFNKD